MGRLRFQQPNIWGSQWKKNTFKQSCWNFKQNRTSCSRSQRWDSVLCLLCQFPMLLLFDSTPSLNCSGQSEYNWQVPQSLFIVVLAEILETPSVSAWIHWRIGKHNTLPNWSGSECFPTSIFMMELAWSGQPSYAKIKASASNTHMALVLFVSLLFAGACLGW